MEISKKVSDGLQTCSDTVYISDKAFTDLCDVTINVLLKEKNEDYINEVKSLAAITDKNILKQAYAALMTFIIECARVDASSTTINTVLENCKFSQERCNIFSQLFLPRKQEVRQLLGGIGFRLPHVVDTHWRVDYAVKSNSLEKLNSLNYMIKFKAEHQTGRQEDIQFCCNVEELQDLVWKLREAVKAVENNSS